MEQIFLSFVIPAYNAERYLPRCLDSILAIGDPSVEIVVINDGSKDGTETVLERYAEKGVRYKTVPNGGVSAARDAGAAMAEGQYVAFVDADDEVDSASYEELLNQLKNSDASDVYMFGYQVVEGDVVREVPPCLSEGKYGREGLQALADNLLDAKISKRHDSHYMGGKVYQYFVRRELFQKQGLCFPKGLPYAEDLCFCLHMFHLADSITVFHRQAYRYYVVEGSASHRIRPNLWNEWMAVSDYIKQFAISDEQISHLRYWCGKSTILGYVVQGMEKSVLKEKSRDILADTRFQNAMETLSFRNWTFYEKVENVMLRRQCVELLLLYEKLFLQLRKLLNEIRRRRE